MFQINVPKNGYETTYCIYNTNELVISIPQPLTPSILNLPSYYKCIGTNPLTLQNTTPIVINRDNIINYIYQNDSYSNELYGYIDEYTGYINLPFGYKIEEEDYLEIEQIAMQTYQNWDDINKIETEEDLTQVKLWPYYNQPQLPAYNQPQMQPQQMQPQQMQPQQMQPQQIQPQQMQPQQMQPQQIQPQQMQPQQMQPQQMQPQQMQQQYAQPQKYLRRY